MFPIVPALTPLTETVTQTGGHFTVVDYNAVGFAGENVGGAWTLDSAETPSFQNPRVGVDSLGAFYVPVSDVLVNRQLVKISEFGVLEWAIAVGEGTGVLAFACAFPPEDPNYADAANLGPEYVYFVTDTGTTGAKILPTIFKYDLVTRARVAGAPRQTYTFAVAGGAIYEIKDTGPIFINNTDLDPNATEIMAAVVDNQVVFIDGVSAFIYNPFNGNFRRYTATSAGSVPQRCRIVVGWNGRVVMTRNAEAPAEIYFGAQENYLDWDTDPVVPSYQQAVTLTAHDMVTAFIPGESDTATIGCDSSILRLFGDPAQGGRIVNVSTEIGIAFGSAWANDDEGYLYFFGQLGEVYALAPGEHAVPVPISNSIRERMRAVDLTAVHVELTWDTEGRGLRVTQKNITPGVARIGWYWEKETQTWNEDDTLLPAHQATSIVVLDGEDPDDRVMLLGCEDGYVRTVTSGETTDDKQPIEASVLLGPFVSPVRAMFWELEVVLASDQGGARYEWFVSERPDDKGDPVAEGLLDPGRSLLLERATGSYVWLRIFSAGLEAWAFESASVQASAAGRHRVTS